MEAQVTQDVQTSRDLRAELAVLARELARIAVKLEKLAEEHDD